VANEVAPRIRMRSGNGSARTPGRSPVGITTMAIRWIGAARAENMIAANEDDYHLRNVTPGKDFRRNSWIRQVTKASLRQLVAKCA
jgi:hypothetical protein